MENVTFHEAQKVNKFWAGVVVLLCVPLPTWAFVHQIVMNESVGGRPIPDWAIWLLFIVFGVVVPLFVLSFRLEAEVGDECLVVRFLPVKIRKVPYEDILDCQVRTYSAIWEYGGWGIKWGRRAGWSYTLSGNQGVQLELRDGKRLLIGSYRAEELARAINEKRSART